MARTTITFTRDSSADIKSSHTRDTSNDITTLSVVGEVAAGSTVNYTVSKEDYSTAEGNVFVDSDKVIDVVLQEEGAKVTVNIDWGGAPAPIYLYVNGVEYYDYESAAGSTTTHTHIIPYGSVVSFHTFTAKGGSYASLTSGNATTTASPEVSLYQMGSAYLVNGNCSFYVWSSIEPS